MTLSPRKFSFLILTAMVIPMSLVLGYNLYIDPFQIYHQDFSNPVIILGGRGTDRYQQAGIINQYDIKSAIIGNSHSANYLPSMLRSELGWHNIYSLTMDGSTLYEQHLVARRALYKNKIENILWGISVPQMMRSSTSKNKKLPLKEYLYDNNRINDLRFFLTLDLNRYYQKKKMRRSSILEKPNQDDLARLEFDLATSWYRRLQCRFNIPTFVTDKILRNKKNKYVLMQSTQLAATPLTSVPQLLSAKSMKNYRNNMQDNLLPIIKNNTSTTFIFVLTAYPTLRLQLMKLFTPQRYVTWLHILKQFVLDMQQFRNVRVHGFDTTFFPEDLRLYKDPGHYHIEVNRYIVRQIAAGRNQLTASTIDRYIEAMDKKISEYRLPEAWLPDPVRKIRTRGYLSSEVAWCLIHGEPLSDEQAGQMSLLKKDLPKCARKIRIPGN